MDEATPNKEEVFEYLDELRKCGVTDFFEAQPFVMDMFNIGLIEAGTLLLEWMNTRRNQRKAT